VFLSSMREPIEKGFFGSLFDFSFDSLVTTKIIRVLYALSVVLFTIGGLIFLITGLASGRASGKIFALIAVPLFYLVYLTATRVWMEVLIVVFRMGDDIRAIRMSGGGLGPRAVPGGPAPVGPYSGGPYSGVPPAGRPPGGPPPGPPPGPPAGGPPTGPPPSNPPGGPSYGGQPSGPPPVPPGPTWPQR
jgi:Domain of unknown function (DUF4282)